MDEILVSDRSSEIYWAAFYCCTVYSAVQTSYSFWPWKRSSNESYWAVHSCGAVYCAAQNSSNFSACGWNPLVWSFTTGRPQLPEYFIELIWTNFQKFYLLSYAYKFNARQCMSCILYNKYLPPSLSSCWHQLWITFLPIVLNHLSRQFNVFTPNLRQVRIERSLETTGGYD